MEVEHQEHIRTNYVKLKASMREKIEAVCNFLCEKSIITGTMQERVMCEKTPSRQTSKLLDLIVSRGKRAYVALYEACKHNGLKDAADILQPNKAPHQITKTGAVAEFECKDQPLPDKWPSLEHVKRVESDSLVVKKVTKERSPAMFEFYKGHRNKNSIYHMDHGCRGRALIILNKHFPLSKHETRRGSDRDIDGLEMLFKGLGFDVIVKRDLNKARTYEAIEKEMSVDHSGHDCFVFFIMSYGTRGIVISADGERITMRSLIEKINALEDLKNKPKLLFFQSCQGDSHGKAHPRVEKDKQEEDHDDIALNSMSRHDGLVTSSADEDRLSIPLFEDVFVFKSSPDGVLSYRNEVWGSWFTQAVIYVFSEHAHEMALDDLVLRVNMLLSKAVTQQKQKNVGEFLSIPGKKLYLFPGLTKDDL